jgi:endonuclease-3
MSTTQDGEGVATILARLAEHYPDARCSLEYQTPFQLLVATMLSAQCTDERVNMVTPAFFTRFPTPGAVMVAPPEEIEQAIRSTVFYHTKARNLRAMSRRLVEDFAGQVPHTMAELLTLPGVARKTANVVLGNAFGSIEGVVVDTHVGRVSRRLGLTTHKDPVKVERDLMRILPHDTWLDFNHRVIAFGRALCRAPRPRCEDCFLTDLCPSAFKTEDAG